MTLVKKLEDHPSDDQGGKHAGQNTDTQGNGKSPDGASSKLEKDRSRDQSSHIGIQDGPKGLLVAGGDGRANRLPYFQLFSYPFKNENISIHGYTNS